MEGQACKVKNVYVIAEAGVNHNGSPEIARRLVEAAAEAGVDAVKFQTFKADTLVSRDAPKAEYQKATTDAAETQYQMLKRLELGDAAHMELKRLCVSLGIDFVSTPFDITDIPFLESLDMPFFKVPSGAITDLPYLRAVNACRKPVVLSSGMATEEEVAAALAAFTNCPVTLLHCTTEYPCPYEDVNLKAMLALRDRFGLPVGYSDHTRGIEVAIAAAALGAVVIEKHFTLDRGMEGPDHKASLEPQELKAMVAAIRNVSKAISGDGCKRPSKAELDIASVARKSIVVKCAIRKGEILSDENLTTRRPGSGISPMRWDEVVNRPARRDYGAGEMLADDELG